MTRVWIYFGIFVGLPASIMMGRYPKIRYTTLRRELFVSLMWV